MKLFILFLVISLNTALGSKESRHFPEGVAYLRKTDDSLKVSCEKIKYRLQEYAKRNAETDYLLEWYSPIISTPEQSKALLNILNRLSDFNQDRNIENVRVLYQWTGLDRFLINDFFNEGLISVSLKSIKYDWMDPFQAQFPQDVKLENLGQALRLTQYMSKERFCLDDSISLILESPTMVLHFTNEVGTQHYEE